MSRLSEPLEAYRSYLNEQHYRLVRETLDALIRRSAVDGAANQWTVRDLNRILARLISFRKKLAFLRGLDAGILFLLVLSASGGVVAFVLYCMGHVFTHSLKFILVSFLLTLSTALLRALWMKQKIARVTAEVSRLEAQQQTLEAQAWDEMAPLNHLFTWDTVTDIIRKILPEITFDRLHSQAHLEDLTDNLDWRMHLTEKISVSDLQSGDIAGNPFVIAKGKTVKMLKKRYSGTKTVWVSKRTVNAEGRSVTRRVPEVLAADIERPFPDYREVAFVLLGSDAAPNLNFSREPSRHSGKEDTFFNRLAKRRTTKQLEAFSRNLTDEYGFTMMANREFETLFHATDRSDEREFRLLFTPYAQQQMVALLNDTTIGYGDDFQMIKEKRSTLLFPEHLQTANIALDPAQFYHYDLEQIKKTFLSFNLDYFKHLYFALAPLLTIPLYCHLRNKTKHTLHREYFETSPWENEVIANVYGDAAFRHPECATPCILKTETRSHGDVTIFDVTAHGYREIPRTEWISVADSNGNYHKVPVEWFEYAPVQQTSRVIAVPDGKAEAQAAISAESIKAMLKENGFAFHTFSHIRATYTAILT